MLIIRVDVAHLMVLETSVDKLASAHTEADHVVLCMGRTRPRQFHLLYGAFIINCPVVKLILRKLQARHGEVVGVYGFEPNWGGR